VQHHDDPKRKTKYSLIAVEKGELLVNMDSQAPNKVVGEWLLEQEPFGKVKLLKPECTYGSSRFDFYLETETDKFFIEVKGVTLEEEGVVRFPDAPTERGVKHLQELCACKEAGYKAAVIFVVQMEGMQYFEPNDKTHPQFDIRNPQPLQRSTNQNGHCFSRSYAHPLHISQKLFLCSENARIDYVNVHAHDIRDLQIFLAIIIFQYNDVTMQFIQLCDSLTKYLHCLLIDHQIKHIIVGVVTRQLYLTDIFL
jgi:sugar fermentation stimulation protein